MSKELAEAIPTLAGEPKSASRNARIVSVLLLAAVVMGTIAAIAAVQWVRAPAVQHRLTREEATAARLEALTRLRPQPGGLPMPTETIHALSDALNADPAPAVRAKAAEVYRGAPEAVAVPALLTALKDPHPDVRRQAILAVSTFQRLLDFDRLTPLLKDPDPGVRLAAASSLARMKRNIHVVIPAVADALNDDDSAVREAALSTLLDFGEAASKTLVSSQDWRERVHAEYALIALGPKAAAAVPALAALTKSSEVLSRRAAVRVLASIGNDASVPALVAALEDEDTDVRTTALDALKRRGLR
jgi:HEAT repeat protein